MDNSIMGASGTEVDFDGRPRVPEKTAIQLSKARQKVNDAIVHAWHLTEELHGNSQLLKVWLEQYRNRLLELAMEDPVCKALEIPIRTIRRELEFKPLLAEKVAKRILGPHLTAIAE